ncbi:hypothetical protein JCM14467A_05000 [Vulcanisaeta sp. JCM 14467]
MSTPIMIAKINVEITIVNAANGRISPYILMSIMILIGTMNIKKGINKPILLKQILTSIKLVRGGFINYLNHF